MIRSWGLHQYGEWLILTAIPTYVMLSPDFGLANAVINQMAKTTAQGARADAICLYRTSWMILTIMALCFVMAGTAVSGWISWKPFGVTLLAPHAAGIVSLCLVQIFLGQQLFLLSGIYRTARRNPRGNWLQSLGYSFYLLVGCAALALKCSPVAYIAANVAARALVMGVLLIDARRIMPDFTLSLRGVSVRAVRPYIIPGLGHAAMPLINAFQNEGMVLVLGLILGPVSVAIFQTTRTAVNGAKSLTGLMSSAVGVEIPALVGEGRMSAVRRLLVMNTQTALAAALGWLTLLGLFGETIFHLWLRSRTIYSTSLVALLLVSIVPFAIANSFALILMATNQIHRAVLLLIPAALSSLAVAAIGDRLYGLNGAAMGVLMFEALNLLVVCSMAAKHTDIDVMATLASVLSKRTLVDTCNSAISSVRPIGSQLS